MAQRYCPECRHPISLPDATSKQFAAQLEMHKGSAKCEIAQAQNEEVGFAANPDKLPYLVRFVSPKIRNLTVRLSPAEQGRDHGGNPIITKKSRWANFKAGQYETSSLFEVLCLRSARNNGGLLEQEDSNTAHHHRDRFWEEGCFDLSTGEPVDPEKFAAVEVHRDRSYQSTNSATA